MKIVKALVKGSVILMLASSAVMLTACANKKSMSGDGSDGAQTYGSAQGDGYDSENIGYHVNSLKAPSNQIYYFAFDNSDMRQEDMKALMIQASYLAAHPNAKIRLEGNTDDRGSREYNVGLGWRRDQSVARILEQQGVRANQIQMVSLGKQNPAVTGENEKAWALNRRAEMLYKQKS